MPPESSLTTHWKNTCLPSHFASTLSTHSTRHLPLTHTLTYNRRQPAFTYSHSNTTCQGRVLCRQQYNQQCCKPGMHGKAAATGTCCANNTSRTQKSHSHSPLPSAEPGALLPDSRTAATAAAASAASAAARAFARWRLALLLRLLSLLPTQCDSTCTQQRGADSRLKVGCTTDIDNLIMLICRWKAAGTRLGVGWDKASFFPSKCELWPSVLTTYVYASCIMQKHKGTVHSILVPAYTGSNSWLYYYII